MSDRLVYAVTDRDGNRAESGIGSGDTVAVLLPGINVPVPFKVVATNQGHGRMSLVPTGEPSAKNLITGA